MNRVGHVLAAEESVGKALLQAVLAELRLHSPRFNQLNEQAQGETIDRLRAQVAGAVQEAVATIAAAGYVSVRAKVSQVTFKDGVKATLEMLGRSEGAHALADADDA